ATNRTPLTLVQARNNHLKRIASSISCWKNSSLIHVRCYAGFRNAEPRKSAIYRKPSVIRLLDLARPLTGLIDPQESHRLAINALKLLPSMKLGRDDKRLALSVFRLDFRNPIGIAAGFDKNADVPDAILGLGFGFAEIGTVTPKPQAGNPRPRLFRLPQAEGV